MKKIFGALFILLLIIVLGCLDGILSSDKSEVTNTENETGKNDPSTNNSVDGLSAEQTAMRAVMMFNLNDEILADPLNRCVDRLDEKVQFSDEYMQCMHKIANNGFFDEVEKCNIYEKQGIFPKDGKERRCRIECKKEANPGEANPEFNNCEKICEDIVIQKPDDIQQKFNGCIADCDKNNHDGAVKECHQKCQEILDNNQLPPEILQCKIKCKESFNDPNQVDGCIKICLEPRQFPPAEQCETECKNKTANGGDFLGCMDECTGKVPPITKCEGDCKDKFKDKPEEIKRCIEGCPLNPPPIEEQLKECQNRCDKNINFENEEERKACFDKCNIEFGPKYILQDNELGCKDDCKIKFNGKPLELEKCVKGCDFNQQPPVTKCEEFCKNDDHGWDVDLKTCIDLCEKDRGNENPPVDECKVKCGDLEGDAFEHCLKGCAPIPREMPPIDLPVLDDRLKEHKECTEKCNVQVDNQEQNNFNDIKLCFKECDDKFLPKANVNIPEERRDDLFGRCIDKIKLMLKECKEFAPEIEGNEQFRQCIKDKYGN